MMELFYKNSWVFFAVKKALFPKKCHPCYAPKFAFKKVEGTCCFLSIICSFFFHRMEGDYENVSHIQPPRYTETYDIPPQLFHQPTSIPDKNSFDNNSNINTGINDAPNVDSNSNINVEYYDTPSQIMKQPVSTPGKTDFDHNSNVNTGKNDDSIMGMQQPASVSNKTELNSNSNNVNYDTPPQWKEHTAPVKDKAELDSNSNVNTGNYDTPPQWRQQPSSVPDKKELDDVGYYDDLLNVNQEPATISNKSELEKNLASSKETSKSNTQEEDKTVLLRFNEFGTASGIMMIINMVSKEAVSQRSCKKYFLQKP